MDVVLIQIWRLDSSFMVKTWGAQCRCTQQLAANDADGRGKVGGSARRQRRRRCVVDPAHRAEAQLLRRVASGSTAAQLLLRRFAYGNIIQLLARRARRVRAHQLRGPPLSRRQREWQILVRRVRRPLVQQIRVELGQPQEAEWLGVAAGALRRPRQRAAHRSWGWGVRSESQT